MKLQVITTLAVLSGFFATTSADAGQFDFGKAVRTAQQINRTVNAVKYGGGQPQYKPLPYPGPGKTPTHGGNGYVWNPPAYQPQPPVYKPLPHPGHGHGHKPVCKPPVNRPPVKLYKMVLQNNTGAEVFYSLNNSKDYDTMPTDDLDVIKSRTRKPHLISYHNGHEVVEYELAVDATYSFEWEGDTLQLLEIQG